MTRIDGDWITAPETVAVLGALEARGHRAFFVGGCVRDALAGLPVRDIDIATDARPDDVMNLAEAADLKAVGTGLEHGTVTVVSKGRPFEVTTFRKDVETDGRHAVVAFSDTIDEDAQRRDFTINALYAERTGDVLDPTGSGVSDLAAGRVRFVGEAQTRIREDYLRILRYFRFFARFGSDGPDSEALHAISSNLAGLETLSAERIGAEIKAFLALEDPSQALASMASTGALSVVLPGAEPIAFAPLVHLEGLSGIPPDPIRRLAAIGGEGIAARLRLSRAESKRLDLIRTALAHGAGAEELGYRFGERTAVDALLIHGALAGAPLPSGQIDAARRGEAHRFPVRASDLMPDISGKDLGTTLKDLEERWIKSGFRDSRDDLLGN